MTYKTQIHNFRLRFIRSLRDTLNVLVNKLQIPTLEKDHDLFLKARGEDSSIKDSESIIFFGSGWKNKETAFEIGERYSEILSRTYARLRLGADFGDRAPKSWITEYGLELMSKRAGRPLLNDVHGLMAYDKLAMLEVAFVTIGGEPLRGVPVEQFLSVFETALSRPRTIDDRERVARELFNASFFQPSEDGRILLLMSGIEAMIVQQKRSPQVQGLLKKVFAMIGHSHEIDSAERNALKQSIGQLKRESIGQAGRWLVTESLDGRDYEGMTPSDLFSRCYRLRCRFVHGDLPFPTRDEPYSCSTGGNAFRPPLYRSP